MRDGSSQGIRIWDLPTRVFHWALALAVVGLLVAGKAGGDAMVWHARLGYCVGTLLLFRLAWGVAGGHWSRFATFPPSPARALRYARDRHVKSVGHNPLGALSVYAMLGFLLAQVATGLFSETKDDFAGPLSALVSNVTVHWVTGYHKNVGQWVLVSLVVVHLAAVALYFWRGHKLVGAMVHGNKSDVEGPASRDDASMRIRALLLLTLSAFVMWCVVRLGG